MEKQSFSYKCKGKRKQTIVTDNPYKTFGEKLVKEVCDTPVEVEITRSEDASQCVKYLVKKRSGTVVILEQENTLTNVPEGELKDTYLTCVDPEKNAYKFYRLTPMGDTVKASYGRMGTEKGQQFGERCYMYPARMFWIKLEEKLAKGYIDNSDLYLVDERRPEEETKKGQEKTKIRRLDPVSSALFEMLKAFSKKDVESAGVKVPITQAILDRINKLIKLMRSTDDLEQFNKYVQEATFKSHGNVFYQASWYFIAWIVISLICNGLNNLWMPVAAAYVAPAVYNILVTLITGGVSMIIFFFVFKIIFPEGEK